MKSYATFDDYLQDQAPTNRATIRALRRFVKTVAPALTEAVKWGNGCWVAGTEPIAYVYSDVGHVQFGFVMGSSLKDPRGLLEGTGSYVRHIKVRNPADIDRPAFAALLKQAMRLRRRPRRTQANAQGLLASLEPEVRTLALEVRKLVRAVLPRVQEITDAGTRVIGYGYGPGYRDMVATILLSRGGVKLGLVRGAELPDPRHLLEGRGKVHRYVAFTEVKQVGRPGVKGLLKAAYGAWLERRAVGA